MVVIQSVGVPCRVSDVEQLSAKMALAEEWGLPEFYLELILPGQDIENAAEMPAFIKGLNLPVRVVHAPFALHDENLYCCGLTSIDGYRRIRDAAALARELGARLVLHDDTYASNRWEPSKLVVRKARLWPVARENLKALKLICPEVMVENLTAMPWGDLGDIEATNLFLVETSPLGDLARESGVDVVFDLSHSFTACNHQSPNPVSVASAIGLELIRHLHIASFAWKQGSPPFAEGLPLDQGLLTPEMLRDLLAALPADITVTVEINEPGNIQRPYVDLPNLRKSLHWLRDNGFI